MKRSNGEGSIYQRGDGRYCASIVHTDPATGARKRAVLYGKTRREVLDKLKAAIERSDAGAPVTDAKSTAAAWIEQWRGSTLEASSRRETTKALYSYLARKHLEPAPFGAIPLDRLRPAHVEALILELRARGLADSTVRNAYTVCRAALDGAVRDGLLARNPAALVARPGVKRREARSLLPEDVLRLLNAAKGSRFHAPMVLIAGTGLRRGEALAVRWADVNLDAATMKIRGTIGRCRGRLIVTAPKTEKSRREIRLSPGVVAVLRAHRHAQAVERLAAATMWDETGYVFTTQTGQPVDPRNLLRALKVAATKAELPGAVGAHTLRHSAASAMLENGIGIKTVSEMLGHSSISITGDIYAHVSDGAAQAASDALAAAIGI